MKFLYMSLSAALLCACGQQQQESKVNVDVAVSGDTIIISEQSPLLQRLQTGVVREERYSTEFSASGVVRAIPSHYAEIASPFAGRITKSFVRLGQKLAAGSPVFEVSSPSFYEAGKLYHQAKQEMELALRNLNREKDLLHNKVGVQKELDEAEVNYELKKKDFENVEAALKVFRMAPDELTLGQPLVVTSPLSGEVVTDRIVIGQYLREDAEPMVIIADLSRVWMVAHVKEKDLHLIQTLDEVKITLVAVSGVSFSGKIYHISEIIDEETRSIEVMIECDNSARRMKPGMYGTVHLSDRMADVIRIPAAAILQEENSNYVLAALGGNRFLRKRIVAGNTENDTTVVRSGLAAGERIVSSGAYYLLDAR